MTTKSVISVLGLSTLAFFAFGQPVCGEDVPFEAPQTLLTGLTDLERLAVGDLDGDDRNDLVVATQGGEILRVHWTAGHLRTQVIAHFPTDRLSHLELGDFDRDGDQDILVADRGHDAVYLLRNESQGELFIREELVSQRQETDAVSVLVDWTGDGRLDLFAADREIHFYRGGEFGLSHGRIVSTDHRDVWFLEVADLDRDGDDDLVFADRRDGEKGEVAWMENLSSAGVPAFGEPLTLGQPSDLQDLRVVDLDRDGDDDVVVLSAALGRVVWYENRNEGEQWAKGILTEAAWGGESLDFVDLDRDGDWDFSVSLTGEDRDAFLWFEGESAPLRFRERVVDDALALANPSSLVSLDYDHDGDDDLLGALGAGGELVVYENGALHSKPGGWRAHRVGALPLDRSWREDPRTQVVPRDLDEDGDVDLVVLGVAAPFPYASDPELESFSLGWFENDDSGNQPWLFHPVESSTQEGLMGLQVGDLDGDGDLDLLGIGSLNQQPRWYENGGRGNHWRRHSVDTGLFDDLTDSRLVDLDRDGDLDLVLTSSTGPALVWLKNRGRDSWEAYPIEASPVVGESSLALADFDGDGDEDVLLYLGEEEGTLAYQSVGPLHWYENTLSEGESWVRRTLARDVRYPPTLWAADFDHDGDPDVLPVQRGYEDIWIENDWTSSGTWTLHFTTMRPSCLYEFGNGGCYATAFPQDMDLDGDVDYFFGFRDWILGFGGEGLEWTENRPDRGWVRHGITLQGAGGFGLTAADLDGDGDPDGVSFDEVGDLYWWQNQRWHLSVQGFDMVAEAGASFTLPLESGSERAVQRLRLEHAGTPEDSALRVIQLEVQFLAVTGGGEGSEGGTLGSPWDEGRMASLLYSLSLYRAPEGPLADFDSDSALRVAHLEDFSRVSTDGRLTLSLEPEVLVNPGEVSLDPLYLVLHAKEGTQGTRFFLSFDPEGVVAEDAQWSLPATVEKSGSDELLYEVQ